MTSRYNTLPWAEMAAEAHREAGVYAIDTQ